MTANNHISVILYISVMKKNEEKGTEIRDIKTENRAAVKTLLRCKKATGCDKVGDEVLNVLGEDTIDRLRER